MLQDTTVEAAQEVIKDSPNGVLIFQDELSGWFGAMDKYSNGKGRQRIARSGSRRSMATPTPFTVSGVAPCTSKTCRLR